jgi:Protein of unknown function (DUF3592)
MNLRLFSYLFGAAAVLAAGGIWWSLRQKRTPEQLEQERRARLNMTGRITDGTVIDVNEATNGHAGMQLLIYQYDVAGVQYECSQDVTHLRHRVDLHSCRLGIPTSVKYDPQNPGDSIVVSEEWIGLYQA